VALHGTEISEVDDYHPHPPVLRRHLGAIMKDVNSCSEGPPKEGEFKINTSLRGEMRSRNETCRNPRDTMEQPENRHGVLKC
jgi:hypothetical protein